MNQNISEVIENSIYPEEVWLFETISSYVFPSDYEINPLCNSQYGQLYTKFKALICSEFVRFSIDKNYSEHLLSKQSSKIYKEEFRCHARLLSELWTVVRLLPDLPISRVLIFGEILMEEVLVMFIFFKNGDPPISSLCKIEQNKNRQLQILSNPFDSVKEPAAWCFVENCIIQANKSDDFRNHYMKLVSARMAAIQHLIQNKPVKIDHTCKKRMGRGRKSVKF